MGFAHRQLPNYHSLSFLTSILSQCILLFMVLVRVTRTTFFCPYPKQKLARPGGGASQPKSVVACSKKKIRKDPYCVDFHLGFTPHSTQCWVTLHKFVRIEVTDKASIPYNSSTFCKCCCQTWAFLVRNTFHTF